MHADSVTTFGSFPTLYSIVDSNWHRVMVKHEFHGSQFGKEDSKKGQTMP